MRKQGKSKKVLDKRLKSVIMPYKENRSDFMYIVSVNQLYEMVSEKGLNDFDTLMGSPIMFTRHGCNDTNLICSVNSPCAVVYSKEHYELLCMRKPYWVYCFDSNGAWYLKGFNTMEEAESECELIKSLDGEEAHLFKADGYSFDAPIQHYVIEAYKCYCSLGGSLSYSIWLLDRIGRVIKEKRRNGIKHTISFLCKYVDYLQDKGGQGYIIYPEHCYVLIDRLCRMGEGRTPPDRYMDELFDILAYIKDGD